MTRRSTYQDKRGNADSSFCCTKPSGCSFRIPNQAIVTSSVSRNPMLHPSRRQSFRLKEINAIYESKDTVFCSKLQQQTSEGNCPVARQVENLLLEQPKSPNKSTDHSHDVTDTRYSDNCGNKEGSCDDDEQSIECMTLKDFQTRFKSKKRKSPRSVASIESGLSTKTDVKVKLEEESDLEEPLIRLKLKLSKLSSLERKQKKRACHSENATQGLLSVNRVSAKCRLIMDNGAELNELKSSAASTEERCGVTTKKTCMETDSPTYSKIESKRDDPCTSSNNSVYNVKNEMMETCFLDGQNMINSPNTSTSEFIDKCTQPCQDSRGELDNRVSSCLTGKVLHLRADGLMEVTTGKTSSIPEVERSVGNSFKLVPNSKLEVPEAYSPVRESTIYSSDVDFIAKYDYTESSYKMPERADRAESERGQTGTINSMPSHFCINKVPTEYLRLGKSTCLTEHNQQKFGEFSKMDLSEMSPYQVLSLLVSECNIVPSDACSPESTSAIMHLDSSLCSTAENPSFLVAEDRCHDSKNQMNYSAVTNCTKSTEGNNVTELHAVSKDIGNIVDEVSPQQDPMISHSNGDQIDYSLLNNATKFNWVSKDIKNIVEVPVQQTPKLSHSHGEEIDHSLVSRETIGLCDGSTSCSLVENSNFLVYEALANEEVNSNGSNGILCLREDSSMRTYTMSSIQHSQKNMVAPNDSHAVNLSMPKSELSSVEKILKDYTDREAGSPELITNSINTVDAHSAQSSPCLLSSVSGLQHTTDNSSEAIEEFSSSLVGENLDLSAERTMYPSTDISCSVDMEDCNIEDALTLHPGIKVEDPPRKIFSNRKEKLLQAVNGSDLYDSIKHSGYREAAAMLGPERMIKKPKHNRNTFLPPVTKGILKLPDSSSRTPCSSMKSSLAHMQTEEAIRFSLRQLHDARNIATKLLKGMNTMKNIVEENIDSEACHSTSTKFTAEEIKEAVQHASELEATTHKWLSIMTRDCNRFCKIMRSTENKVTSPINGVHKERKKISFADEAGGMLCHVKVFDQQPASVVSESDS